MKIEVVSIPGPQGSSAADNAQIFRFDITGPLDPKHAVVQSARRLVQSTGSKSMAESFDWALKNTNAVTGR